MHLKMNQIYNDEWTVGSIAFFSRLIIGTGKFKDIGQLEKTIQACQPSLVTIAIRRFQQEIGPANSNLLQIICSNNALILPNTAGSKTPNEAIRLAFLGREIVKGLEQKDPNFVKLEVIPDSTYLMPDPLGTVKAADYLVKKGFKVFPYINADPILARHLEELGCVTIMPLGSSIGSNQGLRNLENLRIIIEESSLPVIPDAGIGRPSDACKALELGAEAVLTNTAISGSLKPEIMAQAMKLAVLSGRLAYLASSPPIAPTKGNISSPKSGIIF